MPPSRPTAAELLDAVREFLERDVLPALAADVRFQCRVAVNVLASVRRELELGPEFESRERDRLAALLGDTDARTSLDALNRRLAWEIREGAGDLDPAALGDHLRRTIREALEINNPRWLDESR
jgi:Domain of unknown function (DUF6285)